jgi:hypothetical protein
MPIANRAWFAPAAWFVAGIFATGAFWYFLSQNSLAGAIWSGLAAIAFAFLAIWFHRQTDRPTVNAPHKAQLAAFLTEAQTLRARLNEQPLPIADHNLWAQRVETYLRDKLGSDYAVRFGDFSGMVFYGDSSEKSRMSRSLEGRSRRLSEFLAELSK